MTARENPAALGADGASEIVNLRGAIDGFGNTKNAPANQSQSRGFTVSNAKLIRKNSLIGALDFELPSGMIIRGAMLLESNGRRWVNLPSESYQKSDGTRAWKPFIEFVSKEVRERFQAQVLPLAERALLGEVRDAS
jgi:hypothetical protein